MRFMIFFATFFASSSHAQNFKAGNLRCTKKDNVLLCFSSIKENFITNTEGPWEITYQDVKSKKTLKKESFRFFIEKAEIDLPLTAKSYRLIAYTCTPDKKQCFREVIEGKMNL